MRKRDLLGSAYSYQATTMLTAPDGKPWTTESAQAYGDEVLGVAGFNAAEICKAFGVPARLLGAVTDEAANLVATRRKVEELDAQATILAIRAFLDSRQQVVAEAVEFGPDAHRYFLGALELEMERNGYGKVDPAKAPADTISGLRIVRRPDWPANAAAVLYSDGTRRPLFPEPQDQ